MNVPGDLTEPVNLGNPAEMTIKQAAEADHRADRVAVAGSSIRPLPEDEPRQRCPDIARARELLDWQPRVPLKAGLERTIAYFERLLSRASCRTEAGQGGVRPRARYPSVAAAFCRRATT